jgi:hypothetical protein
MKGGSPAYAYHQNEGFLSQSSNVEHTKPITYYESAPVENYANLYQISGGGTRRLGRRKRGSRSKRTNRSKRGRRPSRGSSVTRRRRRSTRGKRSGKSKKRCGCVGRRKRRN